MKTLDDLKAYLNQSQRTDEERRQAIIDYYKDVLEKVRPSSKRDERKFEFAQFIRQCVDDRVDYLPLELLTQPRALAYLDVATTKGIVKQLLDENIEKNAGRLLEYLYQCRYRYDYRVSHQLDPEKKPFTIPRTEAEDRAIVDSILDRVATLPRRQRRKALSFSVYSGDRVSVIDRLFCKRYFSGLSKTDESLYKRYLELGIRPSNGLLCSDYGNAKDENLITNVVDHRIEQHETLAYKYLFALENLDSWALAASLSATVWCFPGIAVLGYMAASGVSMTAGLAVGLVFGPAFAAVGLSMLAAISYSVVYHHQTNRVGVELGQAYNRVCEIADKSSKNPLKSTEDNLTSGADKSTAAAGFNVIVLGQPDSHESLYPKPEGFQPQSDHEIIPVGAPVSFSTASDNNEGS